MLCGRADSSTVRTLHGIHRNESRESGGMKAAIIIGLGERPRPHANTGVDFQSGSFGTPFAFLTFQFV